ncbi:MAG: GntR family transcriptional regulator, partial [Cetobacterium sp.]
MEILGYKEIANDLENQILNNILKEGDKIPSERDLSTEYKVTRTTVRRAIDYLINKGFLTRKTGSGTYVEKNHLYFNVQEQISFSEKMKRLDENFETKVIEFSCMTSTPFLKEVLALKKNEEVIYAKRIRYINGTPVNIETTYMPKSLFPEMDSKDLENSKYSYVEKNMGYHIQESENTLIPILSDRDTSELFSISAGAPIFLKKSRGLLDNGKIFEYSELYYNPKYYEFS